VNIKFVCLLHTSQYIRRERENSVREDGELHPVLLFMHNFTGPVALFDYVMFLRFRVENSFIQPKEVQQLSR